MARSQLVDCWGDDVPDGQADVVPDGGEDASRDETVAFGWIAWPSTAGRAMRDGPQEGDGRPAHAAGGQRSTPFDGKRMIYGGFEAIAQS